MRTEIGIRMIRCPAVENLGQRGSLPTSGGQAPFQHEHQHDIAFGGKVRDILSNNRPAFRPGGYGHLRVAGRAETDLSDMDRVVAVGVAQEHRRGHREHLIDYEGGHASSASRCCDVRRLRSAMASLRAIRALISSE